MKKRSHTVVALFSLPLIETSAREIRFEKKIGLMRPDLQNFYLK